MDPHGPVVSWLNMHLYADDMKEATTAWYVLLGPDNRHCDDHQPAHRYRPHRRLLCTYRAYFHDEVRRQKPYVERWKCVSMPSLGQQPIIIFLSLKTNVLFLY